MEPAGLVIAIAAAAATSVAPLAFILAARSFRVRQTALVGLAGQLDGEHVPGGLFRPDAVLLRRPEGTLRIRKPEATSAESAWPLVLELQLQETLPYLSIRPGWQYYGIVGALKGQDVQVGHPKLDRDFRIEGHDAEALRFLIRGDVVGRTLDLTRGASWGDLKIEVVPLGDRAGSVLLVYRGAWIEQIDRIRGQVDGTCALGQAMVERWLTPWTGPAERWKLDLAQRQGSPLKAMTGTVDGFDLWVHQAVDEGRRTTRIHIAMSTLGGLRIAHKEHAREAGWLPLAAPVGNPVLDMLLAVKAHERDPVRALLADEQLTAELLELLHGRPGSELDQQGLTTVLPGHVHPDLEGPIEQTLALARDLRRQLSKLTGGTATSG